VKRLLFDINVILDVLLDRLPHADVASDVWGSVEDGRAAGLLSAHAVTTIHYLNAREVGPRRARQTTDAILSVFDVATVDRHVLHSALALGWTDFEDAVTAAAAQRAKCDALITRNPADFKGSPVRVLTPAEVLPWLNPARPDAASVLPSRRPRSSR
jgi:predicted nucleic acid-binding protein